MHLKCVFYLQALVKVAFMYPKTKLAVHTDLTMQLKFVFYSHGLLKVALMDPQHNTFLLELMSVDSK